MALIGLALSGRPARAGVMASFDKAVLRIVLDSPAGTSKASKKLRADWTRACGRLGAAFNAPRGYFGHAIFPSSACYLGTTRVAGSSGASPWVLTVKKQGKDVALSLAADFYPPRVLATVTLPGAGVERLKDEGVVRAAVLALADQLPFAFTLKGASWRAGGKSPFLPIARLAGAGAAKVKPYERIVLYRLEFDGAAAVWRSTVLGHAKRKALSDEQRSALEDDDDAWQSHGWVVESGRLPVENGVFFAHNADGPGEMDYTEALQAALAAGAPVAERPGRGFVSAVGGPAATSYALLRYGVPYPEEGALLLPKTRRWLGAWQARGGKLAGLSVAVDHLKRADDSVKGVALTLGWTRVAAGYNFGWPLWNVLWLDAAPFLGLWRVEATLPVRRPGGGAAGRDYDFAYEIDLGYSLGGEVALPWGVALRLWHERDVTTGLLLRGKNRPGASSERYGADLYARVASLGGAAAIFLSASLFQEKLLFTSEQGKESSLFTPTGLENDDAEGDVYYGVVFGAAGLGVTW